MRNAHSSSSLSLTALVLACLASAGLFAAFPGEFWTLLPLVIFGLGLGFGRLARTENGEQSLLLGFVFLSLLVDDLTAGAWGNAITPWTEEAGRLLFISYGLSGIEYFACALLGWLLVRLLRERSAIERGGGFWVLLGVASATCLASLLAGVRGLASGGQVETAFIQLRYVHMIPIWSLVGFLAIKDSKFFVRLLQTITLAVLLKALQALAIYALNRSQFALEEYLVDHFYSIYCVVAFASLGGFAWRGDTRTRLVCLVAAFIILPTYILNDRRTSYAGIAFAFAVLPFLLPWAKLRPHLLKVAVAALLGLIFVGATWNMPRPLGFVGSIYRSFTEDRARSGASYRDLEDANLLRAVSQHPSQGMGYGKEFELFYPMPNMEGIYDRFRMIPHNLLLAGWAYGGPLTLAGLSLMLAAAIGGAGRMLRLAQNPEMVMAGTVALFFAVQMLVFIYADLGLQMARNQMLLGLFLGGTFRILGKATEGVHTWR